MTYFYLDESPVYKEKFMIRMKHENFEKFFPNGIKGSYNLMPARLLNLSYADYLRFARDVLKGEIIGKGHRYPVVFFNRSKELTQFLKLLNKRMEYINSYYETPFEFIKEEDGTIKKVEIF